MMLFGKKECKKITKRILSRADTSLYVHELLKYTK